MPGHSGRGGPKGGTGSLSQDAYAPMNKVHLVALPKGVWAVKDENSSSKLWGIAAPQRAVACAYGRRYPLTRPGEHS